MEREEPSKSPAESDRLVGSLINGKYRVHASVGAGGMGMIYRAEQLPLGRSVALKILRAPSRGKELAPDLESLKKRFFREASILSKLQHPNIVTIYDYGAVDAGAGEGASSQYFMAMEFLSGPTLAQRAAEGPLPIATAVRIASQIARGLGEAHAHGIVHRDLKPSNIMLVTARAGEARVKVIDFGIVKLVGEAHLEEDLTVEGTIIGSPRYMAPEQFVPTSTLDRRADIWALGVVLYRLLTGKAPFDGETTGWLVHDVLNAPVPRVGQARFDSPPELDQIVARCLERSPALRYAEMAEVADALDALGFGAVAAGTTGATEVRELGALPPREPREGAIAPVARTVRPPMPSEVTTGPESMIAISTRHGAPPPKRSSRVVVALAALGLVVCAVVSVLVSSSLSASRSTSLGSPAAAAVSPPAPLATTVLAPVSAVALDPVPSASVAPPALKPSAVAPEKALPSRAPKPWNAGQRPARANANPNARPASDSDIPTMR